MFYKVQPGHWCGVFFCLSVFLWAPFALASDGHGAHAHDDHDHDEHAAQGVRLTDDALQRFGVQLAEASPGRIRPVVKLPGQIHLNEEAVAHITPRFPAKVLEVLARTGDKVNAGQVLARAESSETLARFELKSLISGQVIERHITLGEHLQPSDNAFVVADLSTLWLDIALYPQQWRAVQIGQTVSVQGVDGAETVEAHIGYIAPTINEQTRTGLARVFLDNREGRWKPGMFVEASLRLGDYPESVVVPLTAVIDLEGEPVVFVADKGQWRPQPVQLGRKDSRQVAIVQGLSAGQRYVSDGGFVLKAQLQKSEFESGHNH